MDRLNRLVCDCAGTVSELCTLGATEKTDKSPFSEGIVHRHPYTGFYDLLFAGRRYDPLVMVEIGILQNASMRMWRKYFPYASLFGLDFDSALVEKARSENLWNTKYATTDVSNQEGIRNSLGNIGRSIDILIDDSTHLFDHQINVVAAGLEFVKPGGMIIIEDIFRPWDEARYHDALKNMYQYFSSGIFVDLNHPNKMSSGSIEPYYDNDKILVLFRNDVRARL